jgi:DnaK suppressor protein
LPAGGAFGTVTVPMTTAQRVQLQQRLLALRDEAMGKEPARIEPNRTDDASTGVADEDAQALSEMHQALASKRNQGRADLLGQIVRAIDRLAADPDLFGLCEECEEEIPWARLEAVPHATLCTACQAKRDPQRNQRRRSSGDFA